MLPQELLRQEGGDTIPLCAVRKGSERPKRKRLRRAVGPAAGGWNEAAGDGKQPLWHSCLWKHDGCSGPLSERTEKYRLAESLRLHLHPYNLGEVLHLWLPKSILSLFRVKIQLGYDNSLQILRSGFPAILGGGNGKQQMIPAWTAYVWGYNNFYNYCLNKIYIFSSKCVMSRRKKIIFWNLRYFKSFHISKWEAKTFLQIQTITRILKKTHFRRLISFWGLFAQSVMTRGLKAFGVVVF